MDLPILDLSQFASGTTLERANFVEILVNSLAEHGFFKLINHGFSKASIIEVFDKVKALCSHR